MPRSLITNVITRFLHKHANYFFEFDFPICATKMNRYVCSLFILGLLIFITTGVYAGCSPSANCDCPSTTPCECPSTDTGGLFCGWEMSK